jgi:hypothetical protein
MFHHNSGRSPQLEQTRRSAPMSAPTPAGILGGKSCPYPATKRFGQQPALWNRFAIVTRNICSNMFTPAAPRENMAAEHACTLPEPGVAQQSHAPSSHPLTSSSLGWLRAILPAPLLGAARLNFSAGVMGAAGAVAGGGCAGRLVCTRPLLALPPGIPSPWPASSSQACSMASALLISASVGSWVSFRAVSSGCTGA